MNIHCLQHVPYEGPGYIENWAEDKGYTLSSTQLFKSNQFPAVDSIDMLFVLGGPMGVYDEKEYQWLRPEKEFINRCIQQDIKIVGICLGAQLIADVMEAAVYPMEEPEIGWFPITWSSEDTNFLELDVPETQTVLHWHGDTFELPAEAELLASNDYCKNQAFLVRDQILGLQFHLEMRKEDVASLIRNSQPKTGSHVQSPNKILQSKQYDSNHETFTFLMSRFTEF